MSDKQREENRAIAGRASRARGRRSSEARHVVDARLRHERRDVLLELVDLRAHFV